MIKRLQHPINTHSAQKHTTKKMMIILKFVQLVVLKKYLKKCENITILHLFTLPVIFFIMYCLNKVYNFYLNILFLFIIFLYNVANKFVQFFILDSNFELPALYTLCKFNVSTPEYATVRNFSFSCHSITVRTRVYLSFIF